MSKSTEIASGGYIPFSIVLFDHRVLWVKLKLNICFRYTFQSCVQLIFRKIKCKDLGVVSRIQNSYKEVLIKHNPFNCMFNLQ